jgi:carbamoyl-phosphate synthase/aspartate carbamoyltransferase
MTPNGSGTPAVTPGVNLGAVNTALTPAARLAGANGAAGYFSKSIEVPVYEEIEWFDPNTKNLVADGKRALPILFSYSSSLQNLIFSLSLNFQAQNLLPQPVDCVASSVW